MGNCSCNFKLSRLDTKLVKMQKVAEIAKDIMEKAESFLFIQDALKLTTTEQGFEMIVDDVLLESQKKAHALTQVFSDGYDPEGRVCSICNENPCCCTTGENDETEGLRVKAGGLDDTHMPDDLSETAASRLPLKP